MSPDHIAVVLVDLNVILDVLTKREPHYHTSALVWAHIEAGHIVGYLAAHSFTTLHYLLRRHLGTASATRALGDVRGVFQVAAVDTNVIDRAIALGWSDFEDAVQVAAAEAVGADCVVTRNTADFCDASLPVLHPVDFPGATHLG